MMTSRDVLSRIESALSLGQVAFLKVTSPTGYPFLCWVYADPTPQSRRVHTLYSEHGSDFSLTNTHSWASFEQCANWLHRRDVQWLEPDELSRLLQESAFA